MRVPRFGCAGEIKLEPVNISLMNIPLTFLRLKARTADWPTMVVIDIMLKRQANQNAARKAHLLSQGLHLIEQKPGDRNRCSDRLSH